MRPPVTPGRHAVIVGVDRYSVLPARYRLRGSVRDARAVDCLLRDAFGFPDDAVRRLEDEAATRDGILAAWWATAERARAGDIVVLYFSGHGSQVRDPSRPAGWTESLVPHDSGRGEAENRDILDIEIRTLLGSFERRGILVTLVIDACFAGGASRRGGGARIRSVEADPRPRPEPRELGPVSEESVVRRPVLREPVLRGPVSRRRYVLLAACGADEVCWELAVASDERTSGRPHDEVYQGCFTHHLCRMFGALSTATSYRAAFASVARAVTRERPRQRPRLEGAPDRVVFGHAERTVDGVRARVLHRDGLTVDLDVGAVHGLASAGEMRWRVRGGGFGGCRSAVLGNLRTTKVEAFRCRAAILDERVADGIVADSVAHEEVDPAANYRRLLAADNRDSTSRLPACLEVELWHRSPVRGWHVIAPDDPPPLFAPGDRIAITVRHHHPGPLFVHVLDFGLAGRIAQIVPEPGGAQRLLPGRDLELGRDDLWPIELSVPDAGSGSLHDRREIEYLKIVAATRALDFSGVEQASFLACGGGILRHRREDARSTAGSVADDWVAVRRAFRLRLEG
ncbi:MAG: caspase family protein [Acidobacteriota bacterium]